MAFDTAERPAQARGLPLSPTQLNTAANRLIKQQLRRLLAGVPKHKTLHLHIFQSAS